jgi:hypothetical protein
MTLLKADSGLRIPDPRILFQQPVVYNPSVPSLTDIVARATALGAAIAFLLTGAGCAGREPANLSPGGTLTAGISSSGPQLAGLEFTIDVDDGRIRQPIKADGGLFTSNDLPAGDHTIRLLNVPDRCRIEGSPVRRVTLSRLRTTAVRFAVRCT